MFRFFLFISLICIFGSKGSAQLLVASEDIFGKKPFFNAEAIKADSIKAITGEIFSKPDNAKMIPKNTWVRYEFDAMGRLERQLYITKKPDGAMDTATTSYNYYQYDKLATQRSSDNFGLYSFDYAYDEKGNLIAEIYSREFNTVNTEPGMPRPRKYPLATETYSYEFLTPCQYKRRALNNLGVAYKETIVNLDSFGRIVEESSRLIITGRVERKNISYDDTGNIIEIITYSNIADELRTRLTFKFDEKGNLLEMVKYKNDQLIEKKELLYEDKTPLFTVQISRNEAAKTIEVIKYNYEFY